MTRLDKILVQMKNAPGDVKFTDVLAICEAHFGKPRQSGTSHVIFKTPWAGDPRINLQNSKGKAKAYQVRQVLRALEKLGEKP